MCVPDIADSVHSASLCSLIMNGRMLPAYILYISAIQLKLQQTTIGLTGPVYGCYACLPSWFIPVFYASFDFVAPLLSGPEWCAASSTCP